MKLDIIILAIVNDKATRAMSQADIAKKFSIQQSKVSVIMATLRAIENNPYKDL